MKKCFLLKILFLSLISILYSCNSTKKSSKKDTKKIMEHKKEENMLVQSYVVTTFKSKKSLDKNPTIKIDFKTNTVSGNAGCNRFGGNIIVKENKITFKRLVATKMYCANFMYIEKEFLGLLSKSNHFKMDGNKLFLFDKADVLLLTCKRITKL